VQGLNLKQIYTRSLIAAFCFHAYQQVSLHDSSCRNYCIYLFLKLHHWCWFQIVLYACTNSIPCVCMVSEHSQFKIYWLNLALILLKVSYMILARVSPVTHSVGNCVKRVVVIVTSVLFFRTPVSPVNSIGPHLLSFTHWLNQSCYFVHPYLTNHKHLICPGTGVALAGVFLYSQLKRLKPKPKAAWSHIWLSGPPSTTVEALPCRKSD
jgi:hypothetical protein